MRSTGGARASRSPRPKSPQAQRSDEAAAEQTNGVFKLQLRPVDDADSFKPSVQLVAREFATRYLESVGVRPSRATMDLVHRNIPLNEGHIRTTLRAKGHVEDEIHISVPPVTHTVKVPSFINPAAVLQLGVGNAVMAAEAEGKARSAAAAGGQETDAADGTGGGGDAPGGAAQPAGADFLDLASRYLHPFNMDLSLAKKNIAALYAAARHRHTDSDEEREAAAGKGGGAGRGDSGGRGGGAEARMAGSAGASTSGRGQQGPGLGGRAGRPGPGLGAAPGAAAGRGGGAGAGRAGLSAAPSARSTAAASLRGALASADSECSLVSSPARGAPSVSAFHWDGFAAGGAGGGGGGGPRGEGDLTWEVLEELAQPLLVTPEVILMLQAQLEAALTAWHRNTAPEALKGRLTAAEFAATLEELSSEAMIRLLLTLSNFLHEEFVRAHPSFPEYLEARMVSREGLPTSHSRRHDSLEDRLGSNTGEPGPGGLGASLRQRSSRSLAGGAVQSSLRTQQMTNLQKYDLGYQAYVKKKLDRPRNGAAAAAAAGGGGGGGATSRGPATARTGRRGGGGGGDPGPNDLGRPGVSFAVAPHYHEPGSPTRSITAGGPSAASSLWGGLSLPGTARSGAASPTASRSSPPHVPPLDTAASFSSSIAGLPPRVGRALCHSTSLALASAASTARVIHSSLGESDLAALQSERLFALHVEFAGRFKALRQSRSGMFFTLPVTLLSMRLCVNTLFSTLYPLWTRLPEGAEVLEHMDQALTALFDPHGYLERALSLLQSTPSAIEAVTRHPQRRGNERQHFNDTSPLLQATLQGAKSSGARKLMKASANQPPGRSLLRTQLTTEQRQALFQRGLQWMQQPDPELRQMGEPQAVGRM